MHTSSRVIALAKNNTYYKIIVEPQHEHATPITYQARAVVLASGGFGANTTLLQAYAPQASNLPTTNGAFATGDGLALARDVGAATKHLEQVQVHPTGFVDPGDPDAKTKFLAPEKLRGVGGVLVDEHGRRFVNELATRDVVYVLVGCMVCVLCVAWYTPRHPPKTVLRQSRRCHHHTARG